MHARIPHDTFMQSNDILVFKEKEILNREPIPYADISDQCFLLGFHLSMIGMNFLVY